MDSERAKVHNKWHELDIMPAAVLSV